MAESVTPETMQRVLIKRGWLVSQFAKYIFGDGTGRAVLPLPDDGTFVKVSEEFAKALDDWDALVAQKNAQYDDSWQVDGPVVALVDLREKLNRLNSATRSGAILEWDPDKKRYTIFDIIVRAMMVLAWDDLNFKDDDDDRQKP